MAGGRRAGTAAGLCLAALLAGGCSAPEPRQDAGAGEVRALLDRRADAVVDRDEKAYLATGTATGAQREEFANLTRLPLGSWEYRLKDFDRTGSTATATAGLRYRIDGYDRSPVRTTRSLELTRRDGSWHVAADRPAAGSDEQLWEQGRITVVRGERSLVVGTGRSREELRDHARLADRAVPRVRSGWDGDWAERIVVLVPGTLKDMGALLGEPASGYRGIAAVTTGETGTERAPADRIILNPDAYGVLGDFGQQFVLTHEATHVATRDHTSAATPLWLSEGLADWVAYRGTGRTAAQAAPELRAAVESSALPARLPRDEDFGFSEDQAALAQAYEGGWLACRMIAEHWGEDALLDFYRAVGEHDGRPGAVEEALHDVLKTDVDAFTNRWRDDLRTELG